mgnify:CR=1 FL=1
MPAEQVDAMHMVTELNYDPARSGAMNLLRDLLGRSDVETIAIAREGFRLELSLRFNWTVKRSSVEM